jgi:hypothetical protein
MVNPKVPCARCGAMPPDEKQTGFPSCARCKQVRYCSIDCQQKDWKSHKKTACRLSSIRTGTRGQAEQTVAEPSTRTATSSDVVTPGSMSTAQQRELRDRVETAYLADHCTTPSDDGMMGSLPNYFLRQVFTSFVPLPDYAQEFFHDGLSEGLRNHAIREEVNHEYIQSRIAVFSYYESYVNGDLPQSVRDPMSSVLLRRLNLLRHAFPGKKLEWYFSSPPIGSVYEGPERPAYHPSIAASFSNFITPASHQRLISGRTHVAVGFVDLSLLLDCRLYDDVNAERPLTLYGYDSSAYVVAKSLVIWDLMENCNLTEGPSQVVQVWYSAVWTKRTTNAFLVAAKRLQARQPSILQPAVAVIIRHWAQSKGVGLKRTMSLRKKTTKNESSHARYFQRKCDWVEMLRYHLTGEFGLAGEPPCSGSIAMWDCPERTPPLQRNECVFNTISVQDVLESDAWDGHYFRTAEKEKTVRVSKLMANVREGKVLISLRCAMVCSGPVANEIASLNPHSISWSNVLDYFLPHQFHELAKACSTKTSGTTTATTHFGYSMNWPVSTFGSSIMDFEKPPTGMLEIIDKSNESLRQMLTSRRNSRRLFSFPIRKNPENTTAYTLALEAHKSWAEYFFRKSSALVHKTCLEEPNPLSSTMCPVSLAWTYTKK